MSATSETTGQGIVLPSREELAAILGEPVRALGGWVINRLREDGAIDANIPLAKLNVEGVPVDSANVTYLKGLFDERAQEVGGTGQRDPVVVGHVPKDDFYVLDGFHRVAVQIIRGVPLLHATVEPKMTYDQVVQRRLEYANAHSEIEFARQVEWVQSAWERTPWHDLIPNVLTAFRALQDDYAYGGTEDVASLDDLEEADFKGIREWVTEQSTAWRLSPKEVRENLAQVEHFSRALIPYIHHGRGLPPKGKVTLKHVQVITATYPGEHEIQRAVVDLVTTHSLTSTQTRYLINKLEDSNPKSPRDIARAAKKIDFDSLKGRYSGSSTSSTSGYRPPSQSRTERSVQTEESVSDSLHFMRGILPRIKKDARSGNWGKREIDDALEISATLAETVAELTRKPKSKTR